jgi:hypothetical protein
MTATPYRPLLDAADHLLAAQVAIRAFQRQRDPRAEVPETPFDACIAALEVVGYVLDGAEPASCDL